MTTLRAMLHTCSEWCDFNLTNYGYIETIWYVETAEGKLLWVPAPPVRNKDVHAAAIRVLLERLQAVRVVGVRECWYLEAEGENALDAVNKWFETHDSLEGFPGRREGVLLQGEDELGDLCGRRAIIRDGDKVSLGPLEIYRPPQSEGRFVGMLPRTGTLQ